ncbi:MAG TPA: chorismate-binding protein [Candidatus Bathyarchaeia archaeon]|nr:chorismate-binding protein [Candidatus Bathyarchaeia archaeon]
MKLLVKCLKCGEEVVAPPKEWDMHPKDGRGPALHIKHYSCPQCGKKFRLATKLVVA